MKGRKFGWQGWIIYGLICLAYMIWVFFDMAGPWSVEHSLMIGYSTFCFLIPFLCYAVYPWWQERRWERRLQRVRSERP